MSRFARGLSRRPQLRFGPLSPRHRAQRPEHFQCGTQMAAGIDAPPLPPQPFPEKKLRPGPLQRRQRRGCRESLSERLPRVPSSQQRLAAHQQRLPHLGGGGRDQHAQRLKALGCLRRPPSSYPGLDGVGHGLQSDAGIDVGAAGCGQREEAVGRLIRAPGSHLDHPERPLAYCLEPEAMPRAQGHRFVRVPARVLVPAPNSLDRSHVYQMPGCAITDLDRETISLLSRGIPGLPRTTSAPPAPARASSSSLSIAAHSGSRPSSRKASSCWSPGPVIGAW